MHQHISKSLPFTRDYHGGKADDEHLQQAAFMSIEDESCAEVIKGRLAPSLTTVSDTADGPNRPYLYH